jgi:hypothetical protein
LKKLKIKSSIEDELQIDALPVMEFFVKQVNRCYSTSTSVLFLELNCHGITVWLSINIKPINYDKHSKIYRQKRNPRGSNT